MSDAAVSSDAPPGPSRSPLLPIGEVARQSGTPITTLRYYERRGLVDPPARVGGQRRYAPSVLVRLMVIRFCRIAGLSVDDIATVVGDRSPERSAIKGIARRHIETIDAQLAQLSLARRMMEATLQCTCATVDACTCGAMPEVVAELHAMLEGQTP